MTDRRPVLTYPVLTYDARLREQLARLLVTVARGEQVPALSEIGRELYRGLARFGACALLVRDEAGELHEFISPRGPWLKSILGLLEDASGALQTAVCVDLLLAHDLSAASADPTIRANEANAAIEGRVAAFIPSADAIPTILLTPFHLDLLSKATAPERQEALEALAARLQAPGWRLGAYARICCRFAGAREHAYAFDVLEGALRLADDDLASVLAFAQSIAPEMQVESTVDRALDVSKWDPADPTERAKLWSASDRALACLGAGLARIERASPERIGELAAATVVAAVTAAKLEGDTDRPTQPLVDHALRGLTTLAELAVTGVCDPPALPKLPPESARAALDAGLQALRWLQARLAGSEPVATRQPTVRIVPDPRQFLPPAVPSLEHGNTDSSGPYRHFRLLQTGIELAPLLAEIRANESYWTRDTSRQRRVKVQRHTETISLRGAMREPSGVSEDWHGIALTGSVSAFPVVHRWALDLADRFDSELGRLSIVRLRAGSPVLPHIDNGEYYAYRNRFHLVVESARGSVMVSGSERVEFMPGELWWFDNLALHEAINESNEWRVHLIFDMLPKAVPLPLDASDALPGLRGRAFAVEQGPC